jgi:hypothetical protein
MSLDITFTLSDADLEHFKKVLDDSKKGVANMASDEIISKAKS